MPNDPLWAPWRLDYIKGDQLDRPAHQTTCTDKQKCFICDYLSQSLDNDEANYVVHRGKQTVTLLNRYPYNNGHLLIAPDSHIASLSDLSDETALEIHCEVRLMTDLLKKLIQPEGFNIGLNLGEVAGAGLPGHLHWHIVPRWRGDSNFMTVVADTNVIPQSLSALYRVIKQEMVNLQSG